MKRISYYLHCLLVIGIVACCTVACSDDEEEETLYGEIFPLFDREVVVVPAEGGQETVSVTNEPSVFYFIGVLSFEEEGTFAGIWHNETWGNGEVQMTKKGAKGSWYSFQLLPKDDAGAQRISFDIKPNTSTKERFFYVSTYGAWVYVRQAGVGEAVSQDATAALAFSPERADVAAEGGTVDFAVKDSPSCGHVFTVRGWYENCDYLNCDAGIGQDRKDGNEKGGPWNGYDRNDCGWVTVGVSADRKHLTVELEPNDSTVARTVDIVMDYNGRGHVQVRQAGKAAAGE